MLSISVILDVLTVIIIAAIAIRCYFQGFLSSLIQTMGGAVSFLLAGLLSLPMADWLYHTLLKTPVEQYVQQNILEPTGLGEQLSLLAGLGDVSGGIPGYDSLLTLLLRVLDGLTHIFSGMMGESEADSALQRTVALIASGTMTPTEAVTQEFFEPTLLTVTGWILFLLLMGLIGGFMVYFAKAMRSVNRVPVVGFFNGLGGGLFGVVLGTLTVYIIGVILQLVLVFAGDQDWLSYAILEDTLILKYIVFFDLGFV